MLYVRGMNGKKASLLNMLADKCIAPSTRAFWRAGRRVSNYGPWHWLHGYVYGRWPYLYIAVATGKHPLSAPLGKVWCGFSTLMERFSPRSDVPQRSPKEEFAQGYHGKVVPPEGARRLISVERSIELRDLEQVIPYALARDIVLTHPEHIVALECPCRSCRENPCLPLDVCLVVGEPFASFVAEHHPKRARWIDRGEAQDILQAEHERGHVHHAFFKDAMLQRFYAICNCCSCCCGAMNAHRNGVPMLASSGYLAVVTAEACKCCGLCAGKCPFGAIEVPERGTCAVVDDDRCLGCGVCADACPTGAMTLRLAPEKGVPLEV